MDRGDPVGNSADVFGRRSLHVKIGNKPSEPIPVVANVNLTPGFSTLSPGYPTTAVVGNTSAIVIPANMNRLFAWVINNDAAIVYVQLGSPAVFGRGLPIRPGTKLFVSGSDLWLGDIYAISAGSVTIDLLEATL